MFANLGTKLVNFTFPNFGIFKKPKNSSNSFRFFGFLNPHNHTILRFQKKLVRRQNFGIQV